MRILLSLLIILALFSCGSKSQKMDVNGIENQTKESVSKKTYVLGDVQVTLEQTKAKGKENFCKSKLSISKNGGVVDSLEFISESVDGNFGFAKPQRIEKHLVFTIQGDYNSKTIVVNEQGMIFELKGRENFYDSEANWLFTIDSANPPGFSVFDFENEALIYEENGIEDQPESFHKEFGGRYFILCQNGVESPDVPENLVWEIEFDLNRTMQVDLGLDQINETNVLNAWPMENANCECEQ